MYKCNVCGKEVKEELKQSIKDPNKYMCSVCKQNELQKYYMDNVRKRREDMKRITNMIMMRGGNK